MRMALTRAQESCRACLLIFIMFNTKRIKESEFGCDCLSLFIFP